MKKVGLALGGGGARGFAHISYIKAMEECGVYPSVISGTSSGAIVGAMYAGGMKPEEMLGIFQTMFGEKKDAKDNIKKMKKKGIASIFSKNILQRILPKKNFEDLDIPLKIVATNFHTLEERVFSNGNILDALMCSIAFPKVFAPQQIGDEYYIDGGATNIVPFDIIREECDFLIAIDVSKVRPNNYKKTPNKSFKATWAATQQTLISLKMKHCPVEIFERPDFKKVRTMAFNKYRSVLKQADELMPEFKQKLNNLLQKGN